MSSLLEQAREWAFANGVLLNVETDEGQSVVLAPFTLTPAPFPRQCFDAAIELGTEFNELYFKVANDAAFLKHALGGALASDDFTRRLMDIMDSCLMRTDALQTQPIQCAILRSDYMLQEIGDRAEIKQIELNTIAASFAALSSQVTHLHRYLSRLSDDDGLSVCSSLPNNYACSQMAEAIATTVTAYNSPKSVVLFVVQPRERNKYDQLHLQHLILTKWGIKSIRKTLQELKSATVDQFSGKLFVDNLEVAVVYFRAGYGPDDYHSDADWEIRRKIELSFAVKIPSVAWQLAGAKKVQQVLANPEVLKRFQGSKKLAQSFAGLFELNSETISQAIGNAERFVLKPQREGGGNNLYGAEMVSKLKSMNSSEFGAFILMELIVSKPYESQVYRNGVLSKGPSVGELGIYTAYVHNGSKVILNEVLGHLLRSKLSSSNETGVAAGFGAISSPQLI